MSMSARAVAAFGVPVLLVAAGCSKHEAEKEPTVPVQVVKVEQTTLLHTVSTEAVLFPLAQSAITPKISAPVKQFYVTRGSRVKQGELLAPLENQELTAAVQDTKGAYEQAQAQYETTSGASLPEELQKADLDVKAARQMLDAQEKVYKSRQELFAEGALPRKELDQSNVDYTQAKNQYDIAAKHEQALQAIGKTQELRSAAGQMQSAKGKYLGAQAQLSYSEIRRPIDGVVTDRPLYPGEMAAAGTPLLTVMDVSRVVARAHIPQPEAELLHLGDKATIAVPGLEKPVEGKVTVISPALDPASTTVEIWVEAANPQNALKPGTSVQLSLLAKSLPNALVIPSASLLTAQDGSASVMVVGSDGHAHKTGVKAGIRQGEQVQIVEGLKAGVTIVSRGAYGLPDDTRVTPEDAASGNAPAEAASGQDQKPAAGAQDEK